MSKKILILGSTGFVGQNFCKVLDEKKIAYTGVSRSLGYDLRDLQVFKSVLEEFKPEVIINLAAKVGSLNYVTEHAADVMADNVKMISNMYESVQKIVPNVLIINPIANCSYPGHAEKYIESEWQDGPIHPSVISFGTSRRFLVALSKTYNMQYKTKTINLQVPNMYGPFDSVDPNKAHALNAMVSKVVKAKKTGTGYVDIWGTGKVIREWLFAEDFARLVVQNILSNSKVGETLTDTEILNVGQNDGLTIGQLAAIIVNSVGSNIELKFDKSKPDGAPKKVMDDCKFRGIFPDFKFTEFEKGLEQTIKYYESAWPYRS